MTHLALRRPALAKRLLHVVAMLLLCAGSARADIGATVRELIENQRRILVLRETASLQERPEARRAGQYLFFRNQQLGRKLVQEITQSLPDAPARYQELTLAMDDASYEDEDRLVLRNPLDAVSRRMLPDERRDAQLRMERLADLRKRLGESFEASFDRTPLRPGSVNSARWKIYLGRIMTGTTARQIMEALDRELVVTTEPTIESTEAAARARVLEWNGEELPDKAVLLTFDDGPHPVHTPAILDVLKAQGVHAVFFQVGRNLGEVWRGTAVPRLNQTIVARIVLEGHAIGNHSFSHPQLTRLDEASIGREIADTQMLIDAMVPRGNARTAEFRPPYGARNDKVMAQIDAHHLRSVVWNIDSEDWADPLPASIAHRVVQEAESAGRGIILMHDIHARTVEALPALIRELRKRGFQFARWDGRRLVVDKTPENVAPP